jgi:hypothetical protein
MANLNCSICQAEITGEPALELRAIGENDVELLVLAACDKDECVKQFAAQLGEYLTGRVQ